MIKNLIIGILVIALMGCSTFRGIVGKSTTKEQKSAAKIELVQSELSQNNEDKLDTIAGLSFGTEYALSLSTNTDSPIAVAKELNQRVESIAGLPSLEQQKAMWLLINNLISTNQNLVSQGNNQLLAKDKEIINLQVEKKDLEQNKDKAIANFVSQANATALKTDTLSSQLSKYTSAWGLGGVVLGLTSFVKHIFWTLLIGGTLFIVLRLLSFTNPVAASIFNIFSVIGGLLIHFVEYCFPKSINSIDLVTSDVHQAITTELAQLKSAIVTQAVSNTVSDSIK